MLQPQLPSRAGVLLAVTLLLGVWLPGMTAATAAKGCRNLAKPDATRLRLCNAAIAVGNFTLFRTTPNKFGQIYMTRGILAADLGQTKAAAADMRRAVDMVTGGNPAAILPFAAAAVHDPSFAAAARSDTLGLVTDGEADYFNATLVAQTLQPDSSPRARAAWVEVVANIAAGS